MDERPRGRVLRPGQRSVVHIGGVDGSVRELWSSDELLVEAPNWTLDGSALILNGDGDLWRLPVDAPALERIRIEELPPLNNDHVLDPDGVHVFVSAEDGHLYRAPLAGGTAERITGGPADRPGLLHFLHGVAPDGSRLAFIGLEVPEEARASGDFASARAAVYTIAVDGSDLVQLTDGEAPADGVEYSPDGTWLLFNTEQFDGTAQIARMPVGGGPVEQLTADDRVNWFPHPSPDGRYTVYLAFPEGTRGHPADRWVDVMLVTGDDWARARSVAHLHGGQGTTNVNGWAPTADRFAFVGYPAGPQASP